MYFRPVERVSGAFQQSPSAEEIEEVCQRAFGDDAAPVSLFELGTGIYNNVHRVEPAGRDQPVILRVAPEEHRQFRSEQHLMRNEFSALPWPAPIAHLMPQVISADWTKQVIGRGKGRTRAVPGRRSSGKWARSLGPCTVCEDRASGPWPVPDTPRGARQ